ncbi:MAG TPA: phosphotransferase, partial [Roseiflexaceae bacterium]|nr:phosphotransferase [Roseiflexaceae bacterium]
GGALHGRRPVFEERLARVTDRSDLVTARLLAIWQQALDAPIDMQPVWLHGDLHPQNILVENGALSGIIDWGDMTGGDCATDLAAIWMLFDDAQARREALAAYGPISQATMRRARGWAVHLGVTLLDAGRVDAPRHALVGENTLRRLNASP